MSESNAEDLPEPIRRMAIILGEALAESDHLRAIGPRSEGENESFPPSIDGDDEHDPDADS